MVREPVGHKALPQANLYLPPKLPQSNVLGKYQLFGILLPNQNKYIFMDGMVL